jgi:hypothetical protein
MEICIFSGTNYYKALTPRRWNRFGTGSLQNLKEHYPEMIERDSDGRQPLSGNGQIKRRL